MFHRAPNGCVVAAFSRLPRGYPPVRSHKRQRVEAHPRRGRRLLRPAEADRALRRERLDVHGVALVSAEAHQVAVLVAADDDGNVATALALHGGERAYGGT